MNGKSINLASKGQLPVQISSASSLDSFLIDLPPPSELALQVNSCGGFGIDTTEAEEVTTESSLSPPNNDSMLFAANLFFDLDDSNSVREQAFAFEGLHVAMPSTARSQGRSLAPASSSAAVLINNSVPEFLYQLTKMLTDKNTDVIEWANGRIEVHSPQKLESYVLKKYFRHSKFASFQRQLNYFGFRKLAGKGKMAPCSYINEAADDINGLLQIKRKSGTDAHENPSKRKRDSAAKTAAQEDSLKVNPVLARIYNSSANFKAKGLDAAPSNVNNIMTATNSATPASNVELASGTQQALARRAVGKGIRHGFGAPKQTQATADKLPSSTSAAESLSELASNYQNSLNDDSDTLDGLMDPTPLSQMQEQSETYFEESTDTFSGLLSRSSSLIDLAMIAPIDDAVAATTAQGATDAAQGFGFFDFPNPEVYPPAMNLGFGARDHN